MEASSLFKAAAPGPDAFQPWQTVSEDCVSPDKRQVLKDKFSHSVTLFSARVPREKVQVASKLLRPLLADIRGKLFIQDPDDDKQKLLLFDPDKIRRIDELLSEAARSGAEEAGVVLPPRSTHRLDVGYEDYSLEDALKVVLPPHLHVSGYSVIGHIAHLNLTDEALPYKFVIGQLMLDRNPRLRTVVIKSSAIDNTFRNFAMEVVAGTPDFVAEVKENGCVFRLDFSKVYWNSRLSTEHERVVRELAPDDVVYDLFAGVGPFAVPAARRGCAVLANDLNPESARWLRENAAANSSKRRRLDLACHCLDAREFVRDVVGPDYRRRALHGVSGRLFVIMNLPALALSFCDVLGEVADAAFVRGELQGDWTRLPTLHVRCYCFLRDEGRPTDDLTRATVEAELRRVLGTHPDTFSARLVRNVAVSKNMFCLQFSLTPRCLAEMNGDGDVPAKRMKTNKED